MLAPALELLGRAIACFGLGQLRTSPGDIDLVGNAFEGFLRFLPRGECCGLVKLIAAQRGVSKNGHLERLDFEHATGDIEEMFFTIGAFDAHLTRLERG